MMVRDKLVFTCRDDTAKLKLYDVGADLTLQKTIEILSMRELTRSELASTKTAAVEVVSRDRQREPNGERRWPSQQSGGRMAMSGGQSCGYCNRGHSKGKANCPAAGSVCIKCNKRGHFAVVCRSTASVKLLNEVQQDWQSDQDEE
ncbi:hypothetical protein ACOMHN_037589 [Nucella lapillus]